MAFEFQKGSRQAQHVMEPEHDTDCPEDANFWKNKYKDLQERFTEELEQMEMKWRCTLEREESNKPETLCSRLKDRDKRFQDFSKNESPAELEEMGFQSTIKQLEERNQENIMIQKKWRRRIYELEQKEELWKRKVMDLEKENSNLAEEVKFWKMKVNKVELLKEMAEKHEQWEKRVHQINEKKGLDQVRQWKAKVKKLKKEKALKAHRDVGDVPTEVRAQQVRAEELVEEEQSSGRQIKALKNRNSRLVQKVGSLEKRIKQLEAEREMAQKFRRWEKKVEELKENKRRKKRKKAKAQIKKLIKTNRELDKAWKRKVGRLKVKKTRAASVIQSLEKTIKELKMKFELPVMAEESVEAWEEVIQQVSLGEKGEELKEKQKVNGEKDTPLLAAVERDDDKVKNLKDEEKAIKKGNTETKEWKKGLSKLVCCLL